MPTTSARLSDKQSMVPLQKLALTFFGRLLADAQGRKLLAEMDHSIEFDLIDGRPFYVTVKRGKIEVQKGSIRPRRFDANDVIHFRLQSSTLVRLFDGKIRFTDALIPVDQDGKDSMFLLECTLFKWSVLSWVGRLFRGAQVRSQSAV